MKSKQLNKGIDQLMDEGVAQMFVNQFNGRKIIGTVGQLQFEVIQYRLENEYNAKCRWEPVHLYKACWIDSDDAAELESFKKRKYQYMAKDKDGRDVFLMCSLWHRKTSRKSASTSQANSDINVILCQSARFSWIKPGALTLRWE